MNSKLEKTCRTCGKDKPVEAFRKGRECISCNYEKINDWKNVNKKRLWANNLRHKYGITPEQYVIMFEKQRGCCAICDRHQDEFNRRLAVDHNHITREIRGLLCNHCNHRIVGRHRDGAKLRKIADYVEQGTGWYVPKKKKTVKRKKNG